MLRGGPMTTSLINWLGAWPGGLLIERVADCATDCLNTILKTQFAIDAGATVVPQ
jgi:hypothetical protein